MELKLFRYIFIIPSISFYQSMNFYFLTLIITKLLDKYNCEIIFFVRAGLEAPQVIVHHRYIKINVKNFLTIIFK